jgi:signal transduction histidine kinase/CheY-like chemotaxis protein
MTLAQVLTLRQQDIVARFVSDVQWSDVPPDGVPRSLIVDHIPVFLTDVAAALSAAEEALSARTVNRKIDEEKTAARQHGSQRWDIGYDLKSVVKEYGILRHVIIECADELGVVVSNREFDVLGRSLNVGLVEATEEYVAQRDAESSDQKARLEFLAEAGELLASSLDYRSTLHRLTRLLVPRLADWAVVHLDGISVDDMPIVHVETGQAELVRNLYRNHPPAPGSALDHTRVMQSGAPELQAEVSGELLQKLALNADHLALLRKIGTCSWLMVPLRVQQHMFGALTLGYSVSGRHYRDSDRVLATDLARRASVAIDNARLYQLSQEERSRVESATRAKDEFVAMVSHELRTPLNAILGWTRLMRGGTLPDHKRDHAFEVIERNANAQNQLVNDLLDISRAITGKIKIFPSQVDVGNIVDVALEDARLALDAKRQNVHSAIERKHAVLRGDADRLRQVVWNLLTNAIKFTPKGGDIFVEMRRVESDLELCVRDTGVGIASDFLPHVFDSFRQSDSSATRVHGGLGIGLSITKHLVDLHGGSIEVHSPGIGRGATFTVRLPISPLLTTTLGVSQVPATRDEPPHGNAPIDLQGLRVLVIDDEADARELIGYLLETCGASVKQATSAAEALEVLNSNPLDLIISDIGMPGEDGYALIRSIRTLPVEAKRNVPAIALTAFARNEDRSRALVAGFNVHIAKPVEPSVLVRAVVDLAAHRRATPGG